MTANQSIEIPETWSSIELGEVIDYGKTTQVEPEAISPETWVLELEDIEKNSSRLIQRFTFSHRKSKSKKNAFKKGDVLYGKLRPYLNKVLFADSDGVCTTEIVPLQSNAAVHGRYLFHWMRHPSFIAYVNQVSHGVNMPRLGTDAGKKAPFILAPMPEQKRIADKLDTVLARVDACRERLDRVSVLMRRFRQSVLVGAISGQLTKDWRVTQSDAGALWSSYPSIELADLLAEPMRNGKSVRDGDGTPVLRLTAIKDGLIDNAATKRGDWAAIDVARFFIKAGDFLISRGNGSRDLVGRGGIVDVCSENIAFPDTMIRIRTDQSKVLPKFVRLMWDTPAVRDQIERAARTTAGIWKISQQDLERLTLPLPSIPEQAAIVHRVEALFALADRIESRLTEAQAATDRLTPALLAKAFRGELVQQDPSDEPAAELLKRLAKERSGEGKGSKGTRAKRTAPVALSQ